MPSLDLISSRTNQTDIQDPEPLTEIDPARRYERYSDLLGTGAVKKVYRAFDNENGIEVAWSKVKLRNFSQDPAMIQRLFAEVALLKTLNHRNLIRCYRVWFDEEHSDLNLITEACCSGNLRDYRRKHRSLSGKALKKWAKQILEGLNYLHRREPCVIHRDLNCSNVFVVGNTGQVKIGDFGMATEVGQDLTAHAIVGTPEFMAPERYGADYNELVDIYAFGMCVLEMVTNKIPYEECNSIAEIYRRVNAGVKPQALNRVNDSEFKAFIERCISDRTVRPSAAKLLKDSFFKDDSDHFWLRPYLNAGR